MPDQKTVLTVKDLSTSFYTQYGEVKSVNGVSFCVKEGETLGIIGESGSGKSVTALSIMRVIPKGGRIVDGVVEFDGRNLLQIPEEEMAKVRGRKISMIFQNPRVTLDPYFKIRAQLLEQIVTHFPKKNRSQAENHYKNILATVGINSISEVTESYPAELSVGMCQRVMIAMSLLCQPKLVIADEPTSNLDSISQFQIMKIFKKMKDQENLSMIFISHDFDVISYISDRITVMYGGKVLETASKETILTNPLHPYTKGLINSAVKNLSKSEGKLFQIKGEPPDNIDPPLDCRFSGRCWKVEDICRERDPKLCEVEPEHFVRCHFEK